MALVATFVLCAIPAPAAAYIGPGAGIALLSSFLVLFTTVVLVFLSTLIWPFRATYWWLRLRHRPKPWVKRLVILGFDGQDPRLTDRFRAEGKLPNFDKLAQQGCYHTLATTYPSISPVAWSSFCTGTHPAKHNIYDFLDRDPRTYLPRLSSTEIGSVERFFKIGRLRIPLHKPALRLLRKSQPFWTLLGKSRIWSTVLRVPITFPPEKFYGAQLSAMCLPDLLGTQGTFLLYTTREEKGRFKEGGTRIQLRKNGNAFETTIRGPENIFREGSPSLEIPMKIELDPAKRRTTVRIDGQVQELVPEKLSPWIRLRFRAAPGVGVHGSCRMMVTEMDEHFSLYVTPLNIDPEKPAMPISHPSYYATYLAKKIGPFCTLGLAEDTWALNEGVTTDRAFVDQAYEIDAERRRMFFNGLDQLRKGSLVCVFDATDRIQHMFWRYQEEGHPAVREKNATWQKNVIEEIYKHNDQLVGEVLERLGDGDLLMVLSDHGFTSFRRGVNLNTWLRENGYLVLQDGKDGTSEWLTDVDWTKTRAYTLGLTGMFLNVKGREAQGIVEPGEQVERLKQELIDKLRGLEDEEAGSTSIREAFDTSKLYRGPYLENAPDLIIGYDEGYRTSWDCATGVVAPHVFEDNVKAWSGDHCVDPRLVPGVFFCNRPIDRKDPSLIDIAPTALRVFGLDPPAHMEGQSLFELADPKARKV